jgi:CBS domain-containing protein
MGHCVVGAESCSVADFFEEDGALSAIIAKVLMSGAPVTIESAASAVTALDLMIEHGFRHLPVVNGERHVVGILSLSDLRAALPVAIGLTRPLSAEEHESLRDLTVGEIMSDSPKTILADTPLFEVALTLVEKRISCLPVVDENGLLDGIITESDCLKALAATLWTEQQFGHR